MLKIGIWRSGQDTAAQRLWRRGLTSASLLAEAPSSQRFERIMGELSLTNRVARTTFAGRFAELNPALQECLRSALPSDRAPVVHDWAVSNGVTAAEWFQFLKQSFPQVRFAASDAALYLWELRRDGDAFIVDRSGNPLQYVRPPFVVSLVQPHNGVFALNRRVQREALEEWKTLAGRLEFPLTGEAGTGNGARGVFRSCRRLPLIHPDVLALSGDRFQVIEHSVFEPLAEPVDAIRTMNILNRAYFTDQQLRAAAQAVWDSLHPGGVWIVGRTTSEAPRVHEVSVYRKTDPGWRKMKRIGEGSEIDALLQSSES